MTSQIHELTGFQRDAIVQLAQYQDENEEPPSGSDLRKKLEERYGRDITHAQLYTNLDKLTDRGLIERGEKTRRANYYALTDKGESRREEYAEFVSGGSE